MAKKPFYLRSAAEQVSDCLRDRIKRGRMQGRMPGVHPIAEELGVHHTTVADSFRQLEKEGYLKSEGVGKPRSIVLPSVAGGVRLKVAILLYEPQDIGTQLINELRHQLDRAGQDTVVAAKSMVELDFKVSRIKNLVKRTQADAWLVIAGSKPVLTWFAEEEIETFALFGYSPERISHSAPAKGPIIEQLTQRLLELGHERIVMLIGEQFRGPQMSLLARIFLETLEGHGLVPGDYHLPDWSYDRGSLQKCLTNLFQVTAPTALIVDDPLLISTIQQFANQRKLSIPQDLSLACLEGHPSFNWMEPTLCRLESNFDGCIRHAVRWVNRLAKGDNERFIGVTKAKFIEGGTIGPAPH